MYLKYVRSDDTMYVYDDSGEIIKEFECRHEFEDGHNESGQPRESLPLGIYPHVSAEITREYGPAYGTFYITTGDPRGRDIHGGGSALPDPYAPRQGWRMTYGCLRMQNEDGEELAQMIIDAGNDVELEVVE